MSRHARLAEGIAHVEAADLIVADAAGARVLSFRPATASKSVACPLERVVELGASKSVLSWPIDIAEDARGRLLVLDRHLRQVLRWSGRRWRPLAVGRDFDDPVAIAAVPDGRLLVLDSGAHAVVVLDGRGHVLDRIGHFGSGPDALNCPHDILVAPDGETVFVADSGNRRIQRFRLDGTALGPFGRRGDGPGEFRDPSGLAWSHDGKLLVADHYGHRIQVFDPYTGIEDLERRLDLGPDYSYPARLAPTPDGRLFVSCPQLSVILEMRQP